MLIIIEGTDKTGKSTLCDYLLKNLPNCFILKNGTRPKDKSEKETEKIVDAYNLMLDTYEEHYRNKIMIFDRFLISEWVYSIKRGHESYHDTNLKWIHKRLKNIKDVLIIYCKTDKKTIAQKFLEDKEEHTKIEEIEMISDRYDRHISRIGIQMISYNYQITTPEKICRYIKIKMLGDYNA